MIIKSIIYQNIHRISSKKYSNFLLISSEEGKRFFILCPRVAVSLYVATPIGWLLSFSAYSTVVRFFSLQIMIPIDGFLSGSLTVSFKASI
jgi:hypothetical protein